MTVANYHTSLLTAKAKHVEIDASLKLDVINHMTLSPSRWSLTLAAACFISSSALAQYIWIDENGHKQYSDHTPPASVPKNKILQFGGKPADDQDSATNVTNTGDQKKQPESLAEKELAFKKRQEAAAAKAKKEEDDAKAAATKTENCRRLKEYKQGLESGLRMSEMNANGTTGYMTDEKRAQQLNTVNSNMSECGN